MNNFDFHNPTRILFGKGEIAKLGQLIPTSTKILMLWGGGSIKSNGVHDQVTKALKDHQVVEFSGVEPNSRYETCMKAVEKIKSEKLEFVLSVGGGSVLDAAKFIGAAVCFEGEPWDILTKGAAVTKAMPLASVLTLPATGSEMNRNSVISRESTQEKKAFASPHVSPQFSILDPETTYTLPESQTINGIVDAYVHVIEQYLTYPVKAQIQDRWAEGVMLTLIEEGPKVIKNPNDYDRVPT